MSEVIRTEQIWVKEPEFSKLCHISKNLYNEVNYIVRQNFFNNREWIRYTELNQRLKNSNNYKSLPAQTAQQVLRLLDKSWKGFFNLMKEWKKNHDKFQGKPKPPKYKRKDGEHLLVFTNQQCKIRNGCLHFPKKSGIEPVKTRLDDDINLREVRVVPKGVGYVVEIVYEKEVNPKELDKSRIAGVDLGVRNIVTIANNIGLKPIVAKDGSTGIKSIQQFYNKVKAKLQSIYDRQGIKRSKKLRKLETKRYNKVKDYIHKLSKFIVDWCEKNNIGTLIIGYNPEWKQECEMGKRNNQSFIQIPYMDIINKIQYKAEERGIEVILQEKSHTSKCSFFDDESIEHHEEYVGKRKGRLFKTAIGGIINADVNGALNIIRKAIPDAFQKGGRIGGCGSHPVRCTHLTAPHKAF